MKKTLLTILSMVLCLSMQAATLVDELTSTLTGITTTTYTSFTIDGSKTTSGTAYAGLCAGTTTYIQLRSATSSNYSGIYNTTSCGKVTKISVTWDASSYNRTINFYGSQTAFTSTEELYGDNLTMIGSITGPATQQSTATTVELDITGDYPYIGMRSNDGALYIDMIAITWEGEAIDNPDSGGGGGNTGSSLDDFENGGFEEWTDTSSPVGWTSNAGSNATLSQSTDAHGGNYSVNVAHKTNNQRLASKDYTLAAGTYDVSFYVKSADADALGKVRGGYAIVTDGKIADSNDYIYVTSATEIPAEWTEHTFSFTLDAETTVEFLVMNQSGGAGDLLVDDYTVKLGEDSGNTGGTGHGYEADDPFSVSEVIALAETLSSSETVTGVYVKGIVSKISSFNSSYGDMDYYISDDGTTTNQFYIYNGYYLGGEKFTNEDQIQDGDEVIVTGDLTNYQGTTPELARGSKIYSLNGKTSDDGDGGGTTGGTGHGFEPDDPYTCAEAIEAILASSTDIEGMYVKGIVSQIGTFNSTYGDLIYWISDDGTTSNQLEIYYGLYLNNEQFTSADQIKVSDKVVVYGTFTNYNGTPEGAMGATYIYSLEEGDGEGGTDEPDPSLIRTLENSGVTAGSETATIDFTSQGLENSTSVDEEVFTLSDGSTVVFEKADGNNAPTYYTNGTAVRVYALNTITFACSQEIAKIEMICSESQYLGNDTYTIEWSDTGAVYCNYQEENGEPKNSGGTQLRVQQIIVTYAGDAGDDTGISSVEAEWTNDGVMYNIGGQRVSDSYRGIVIVNGRKMLKK